MNFDFDLNRIKVIEVSMINDQSSNILVLESGSQFFFNLKRIFTVISKEKTVRGNHAHKKCSQILHCIKGEVEVFCSNTINEKRFLLNKKSKALFIPPGFWSYQNYNKQSSILNVLCDLNYDESDYIRNFIDYKKFVEGKYK